MVPRKLKFICSSIINAIQTILHGGWDARTEFGSYTGLLFFYFKSRLELVLWFRNCEKIYSSILIQISLSSTRNENLIAQLILLGQGCIPSWANPFLIRTYMGYIVTLQRWAWLMAMGHKARCPLSWGQLGVMPCDLKSFFFEKTELYFIDIEDYYSHCLQEHPT